MITSMTYFEVSAFLLYFVKLSGKHEYDLLVYRKNRITQR